MDETQIIIENLRSIHCKLDRHDEKIDLIKETLIKTTNSCNNKFVKKPSLISISLTLGIITTIISMVMANGNI